jgi:hypothetical protein
MRSIVSGMVVTAGLLASTSALALGQFGVRVGTGASFPDGEGADDVDAAVPFAIGAAFRFDLAMLALEADALYWRNSYEAGEEDVSENRLALPVTARLDISPVPVLGLEIGAGVEPRFLHDGDDLGGEQKSTVWYLPVVLGATIDLQVLTLNGELRYERQLTDTVDGSDFRNHQLMFFAGAFF